ncbi:MAG TPA: cytochrome c biogenesis protein CcsA [Thermoguttaceae bacterium]|nr:cytochrome c biogenesis protein CcsA [Thermoguttaceae bacterium]
MLSGVGIVCFSASYAIALVLEVSRLLFRSGVRGIAMLGFAGAGLVAHSAYLYHRFSESKVHRLSSEHDWYLVAAWILVVVYLYLVYFHPRTAFGLFLLPLVLGLIGIATWFADYEVRESASWGWGVLHGSALLLTVVAVLVGFMAGLMYFWQARRLKHKLPPGRGIQLPSLEWLQRANSRAIVVSVLALGVGNLSGIVLNHNRLTADRLHWNDPTVLSTQLLFLWLLGTAIAGVFYKPARHGRKVAYLTIASFIFLVITLGVGLLLPTGHGRDGQAPAAGEQGAAALAPPQCPPCVDSESSRSLTALGPTVLGGSA